MSALTTDGSRIKIIMCETERVFENGVLTFPYRRERFTPYLTADDFYRESLLGIRDGKVSPLGVDPNAEFVGMCYERMRTQVADPHPQQGKMLAMPCLIEVELSWVDDTCIFDEVFCDTDNIGDVAVAFKHDLAQRLMKRHKPIGFIADVPRQGVARIVLMRPAMMRAFQSKIMRGG